ncbi:MAG: pyridoxal 5'-phosphate synthase lyase subunit PdxS, partial [Acidimicrobiales bacterium]
THFREPAIVAKVSRGLGEAMRGLDAATVGVKLAERGW